MPPCRLHAFCACADSVRLATRFAPAWMILRSGSRGTRQTKGIRSGRAEDDRFVQDYLWIVGAHGVGRQITSVSSGRSSVRPVRRPARVGANSTGLQRPDAWCRCSQFCAIGRGGARRVDLTIDVSPARRKKRGKRYGDETRAPNRAIRVAKADSTTNRGTRYERYRTFRLPLAWPWWRAVARAIRLRECGREYDGRCPHRQAAEALRRK